MEKRNIKPSKVGWRKELIFSESDVRSLFREWSAVMCHPIEIVEPMVQRYMEKQEEKGDTWFDIGQAKEMIAYLTKERRKHYGKGNDVDIQIFDAMIQILSYLDGLDSRGVKEWMRETFGRIVSRGIPWKYSIVCKTCDNFCECAPDNSFPNVCDGYLKRCNNCEGKETCIGDCVIHLLEFILFLFG